MFVQFQHLTITKISIHIRGQFNLRTATDFVTFSSPDGVHIEIVPSYRPIKHSKIILEEIHTLPNAKY